MRQFFCLVGAFYMASVSPQASAQPARWETLTDEGVRAHEQGRYVEAGRLLSAALKEAENFKQNDSRVVDSLNNLAELYYTHGKYDQAEPLYKRALSIAEQVLSADDPKLARSLNNLGTLYQTQGKYVEAEPLYPGLPRRWSNSTRVASLLSAISSARSTRGRPLCDSWKALSMHVLTAQRLNGPGTAWKLRR